ncbi:putative carbohydrate-binding module family 13 protein [Eutypa lata UCREL1]|uniref:Putative carbohydrate-binding module family 13 protein n=1 Tax=Eutypa lata (strain UCR-EL1) TaxID=1287681 RepID=M7STU1_EUTLA|nr:putative carbohydrate-binding module family 13 protein [Eutypa lata UCREL1]
MAAAAALLMFALAATGFAQAPEGYTTVYITSMVDTNYVIVPTTAMAGSTVVVQTSAETPEQQWYVKDGDSAIQLVGTTLCLDAGESTNWKDMATIYIEECAETESQQWVFMGDGRIALGASSPQECVDLQYMRATPNNPVGLYSCAGLGNIGAADAGINWPLVNVTTI